MHMYVYVSQLSLLGVIEVPKSLEESRGTPLPPIGQGALSQPAKGSLHLPNCPIILAMGKYKHASLISL